jgi:hypothetical protein
MVLEKVTERQKLPYDAYVIQQETIEGARE